MRRTLIFSVLLVALGWASGNAQGGRDYVRDVEFDLFTIDTNSFLDGAAAVVNDSLSFYSAPFSVSNGWTRCLARLLRGTADTLFEDDSVGFQLQSKTGSSDDTLWWPVATLTKKRDDAIYSAPGTSNVRAYNDGDSVAAADMYRVKLSIVNEEDTVRWHALAGSGFLKLSATYRVYLIFQSRGNE